MRLEVEWQVQRLISGREIEVTCNSGEGSKPMTKTKRQREAEALRAQRSKATYLGEAAGGVKPGVVLASRNAR